MCINRHLDTSLIETSDFYETDAPFDMVESVHDSPQPTAANPSNGSILSDSKDDSMETDRKQQCNEIMTYLNDFHEQNQYLNQKLTVIIEENKLLEAKLKKISDNMNDIKVLIEKVELFIDTKHEK